MLDLVAETGGGLVIFRKNGFFQFLLERLHLGVVAQVFLHARGHFAGVQSALVHGFQKRVQPLGESVVAKRAAEPAGFLEIRLAETAGGAFLQVAALFNFLRRAESKQQVGQGETGGVRHALFLRA